MSLYCNRAFLIPAPMRLLPWPARLSKAIQDPRQPSHTDNPLHAPNSHAYRGRPLADRVSYLHLPTYAQWAGPSTQIWPSLSGDFLGSGALHASTRERYRSSAVIAGVRGLWQAGRCTVSARTFRPQWASIISHPSSLTTALRQV